MIKYVQGDATRPQLFEGETVLIAHVSNSRGGWGRGFVLALSKRWPQPEAAYRLWHRTGSNEQGEPFELGNIQCVPVEPSLYVVNMIAQAGYGKNNAQRHQSNEPNTTPPLRPDALAQCLEKVAKLAKSRNATVHMPRIGTGLGGSSWEVIEPIVSRQLLGLSVTVYDYAP
jgi:O-acetyl-ADP-ribose deacetylase (regulator of RNase III)